MRRGAHLEGIDEARELLTAGESADARELAAEASRIRAMLKVYSVLTLLWAIPLRFLIGVLDSLVSPFLGRWVLFDFVRAWLWNLWHLPGNLRKNRLPG